MLHRRIYNRHRVSIVNVVCLNAYVPLTQWETFHSGPIFVHHPCVMCLVLTMRSISLSLSLSVPSFSPPFFLSLSFFPLPLSVCSRALLQTYDDIDLENEPWYKFFSELEFGRPVSQGLVTPSTTTMP